MRADVGDGLANGELQRSPGPAVSKGDRAPALRGRRREGLVLDRLLEAMRASRSQVLVLRGEPGVGKSALLAYLVDRASGCRVARAAGVEAEMDLEYAGLHQLCAPLLELTERLPAPQRDALAAAFGLSSEPAPDRFVVGLAVLGLLSEASGEWPVVCVVDDAQWLDQVSAQIIGFVARRLRGERAALVCAARTGVGDGVLPGLPELAVEGLGAGDARALLLDNMHGPLDAAVCDQIVAESHGNPLAILELPRTWNATELAGGFGLPGSRPAVGEMEQSYSWRLRQLPRDSQLLVLAAAAEPLGELMLLHRAAETLGVDMAAAGPAVDAGLLKIGGRVEFSHPVVRSAAYRSATADDRHRAHHALADATDAETDPDRRAWHRAQATTGPNEELAAELERSASRAQARGGAAAAAAFLQRAVALTQDSARRSERALAAAQACLQAGAFDEALRLAVTAEAGAPPDEFVHARADRVRGHVAFISSRGDDAPALLLGTARRLEPLDLELARDTYLTAWSAALVAAHGAGDDVLLDICRAVRALPPPSGAPRPPDLLLDGLALLATEGYAAAIPTLQRAANALADHSPQDVALSGCTAASVSALLWDVEGMHASSAREIRLLRDAGALAALPRSLSSLAIATAWMGDFAGAASLIAETDSVAAATGSRQTSYALLTLRALQGREAETTAAIASAIEVAAPAGLGMAAAWAQWAAAVLNNGLARYEEAASAACKATSGPPVGWSMWVLPELVEAATRGGNPELARDALARLAEVTQACGTDFSLGIEARCRALLSDGAAAADLFGEAIERLGRTRLRPELARAHLLYGEWLRRENRRVDAREQLRTAHSMLVVIGMEAFAERARTELRATGEKVPRRTVETRDDLTAQERQVAQLARDGLSNSKIGERLFVSPRTVEWHLRNVFSKLGIRSRRELANALASSDSRLVPA
jgi:DNA-binding CsgD family transcriptional regulator/tetratricopeptide (TPR) repeat protein